MEKPDSVARRETAGSDMAQQKKRPLWGMLLLTAALITILYVLLRPMYADYGDRAAVAEAMSLMSGIKDGFTEHFQNRGAWPASTSEVHFRTSGPFTRSIEIARGGGKSPEITLAATLRTQGVDHRVAGKTMLLHTRDGGKTWVCGAGSVPERTLPLWCRPVH